MSQEHDSVRPIQWNGDHLKLLDQRYLPHQQNCMTCHDAEDVSKAIKQMVVRGAPAIGMSAAFGLILEAKKIQKNDAENWKNQLQKAFEILGESRPTAVNLRWALERMQSVLNRVQDVSEWESEAIKMMEEDLKANYLMGDAGAELISKNSGLYTHCNTGSLATAGYGTALGVVRSAFKAGKAERIFAGETRPWLQGARLTSWELLQDNIPVELVVEGAAGSLFADKQVDWVIVGADRITAQGDTANKIGTYNLAVLAKYHGVKFMVVAHSSTIDYRLLNGSDIPIEQRAEKEITNLNGQAIAPEGVKAVNPAFDVTPHDLIDVIVTERGVVYQPNRESMLQVKGDDA